jgi:hypothetical protein
MGYFKSHSPDDRKSTIAHNYRYVVKRRLVKRSHADFIVLNGRLESCRESATNGTPETPR